MNCSNNQFTNLFRRNDADGNEEAEKVNKNRQERTNDMDG